MDKDDKGKGLGGIKKPTQKPTPPPTPPARAGQPPARPVQPPARAGQPPARPAQPPAKPVQPTAKPAATGGSDAAQRLREALNKPKPATPPAPGSAAERLRAAMNRPANRPAAPGTRPGVPPRKPVVAQRVAQQERQAGRIGRPLPKPVARPAARTGVVAGTVAAGAAALAPEIITQIQGLQGRFASLQSDAQLSSVYESIGELDNRLAEIPLQLDALRARGYVHSGQLEDRLEALDAQWDEVRPRVETLLGDHIDRLDRDINVTEQTMNRINGHNRATLTAAETALTGLQSKISSASSGASGLYGSLLTTLHEIEAQLSQVEWMLTQFDESPEVDLQEAEGPLMAVEAQWQQDGDDGPNGILYLTDQRLMFEQKEEVTTKKFLGLFKTESEKLQGLQLDIAIRDVESVQDSEEGGFLGMGKKDILEFVFTANASVSRARFHLKGQESRDWAILVRKVTSGEIDEDRADDYAEEIDAAEEIAAAFPANCPNCYAQLEAPPRGVTSITCEFCGTIVTPEANSDDGSEQ